MTNELTPVNAGGMNAGELTLAARRERRNRYTRRADADVQADIEGDAPDAPGEVLNDEIEVLQGILVQKMCGATRETLGDPQFAADVQTLAKTIGQLCDIRNRIQTSEQFVFTPAAAKKFVANYREAMRLAVEEGVKVATRNIYGEGAQPSVDIAQTGAAIWQAARRNMEQMGQDHRAAAVPTLLPST